MDGQVRPFTPPPGKFPSLFTVRVDPNKVRVLARIPGHKSVGKRGPISQPAGWCCWLLAHLTQVLLWYSLIALAIT